MPPPARRRPSGSGNAAARSPGSGSAGGAAIARRPSTGSARAAASGGSSKLVCTAGPKAGEEFALDGDEVVIGRAVENAVSVPDTSVSRRHAAIKRVGNGWAISDLGSGNGTLVNGEPVTEEQVLRNGDVIACGDTELSFVDVGNSTDRRPVPRRTVSSPDSPVRRAPTTARPRVSRGKQIDPEAQKKKKRLMLLGAIFLMLVVASMGAIKFKNRQRDAEAARIEAEREKVRQQISQIFQDGKNLVRQGKWDEAKLRFEQIHEAAPDYPGVQDYLNRATKEIPNQAALAEAEKALAESRINDTLVALNKVAPDTQQFQKTRDLRAALEAKVIKRVEEAADADGAAARVAQGSKPDGIAAYKQVLAIVDDILAAYPEHRDATVLKERADQRIRELSYVAPPPPKPTAKPWEDATRQFIDGDLTGAFAIANSCAAKNIKKCQDLVTQMKQFSDLYKKLEDLDAKGLTTLLNLSDKITGGRGSKLAQNAGTRAANIFFKSASAAKAAGQYGRALEYAQKALQADPQHGGALQIVGELRTKAKDVYLLGYSLKDTNPDEAINKFKEVMLMAPPGSEWHEKAKRRLEELGK